MLTTLQTWARPFSSVSGRVHCRGLPIQFGYCIEKAPTTAVLCSRGRLRRFRTTGGLTTLHSFNSADGAFYGTTELGDNGNYHFCQGTCGTIYSLSVGLGPF